jgi:hypothetical protein
MKLDSPGEYIVTVRGMHKAILTPKLKENKLIPKCSKISVLYQMTKISDIQTTYDEEFIAQTGTIDASSDNCKNVDIDEVNEIQKHIELQRISNYMDINTKILIPDPASNKKISFIVRSGRCLNIIL